MDAHVKKWGNSLALRIPQTLARRMDIGPDSRVRLTLRGDSLLVTPLRRPPVRLEELLAGIKAHNQHGEAAAGGSLGEESW